MALLDLRHVSKAYPHSKGVLPVLEDVSFTVEQGEFIAIVGPSGCGKSTMVRIINGIVPAISGQVLYNGRQVRRGALFAASEATAPRLIEAFRGAIGRPPN